MRLIRTPLAGIQSADVHSCRGPRRSLCHAVAPAKAALGGQFSSPAVHSLFNRCAMPTHTHTHTLMLLGRRPRCATTYARRSIKQLVVRRRHFLSRVSMQCRARDIVVTNPSVCPMPVLTVLCRSKRMDVSSHFDDLVGASF